MQAEQNRFHKSDFESSINFQQNPIKVLNVKAKRITNITSNLKKNIVRDISIRNKNTYQGKNTCIFQNAIKSSSLGTL